MTCFRPDGHLTDAALTALVRGDCLEELDRLELAEHLAYCDQCLQRYTELLSEGPMLTPARSCRESLRRRIRQRAVQLGGAAETCPDGCIPLRPRFWSGRALP